MANNSKRKLLFIMFMIALMLILPQYTIQIPAVEAEETTIQQEGLSILRNVVGLNLATDDVTTKESQDNSLSYLGVVPQKTVDYNLTVGETTLSIACTFTGEKLQMLRVFANEDSLRIMPYSGNAREIAKKFLNNYQAYTHEEVYGELGSVLNDVDFRKNGTKTSGNIVLDVSAIDDSVTFKWYYTANGAIAPYSKFIAMGFKDGFLEAFVDNWQLYDIGSTNIKLSKEKAIAIALEAAKAHFQNLTVDDADIDVKNFDESNVQWATLIFDSSLDADTPRNEDTLTLYPVWHVGISLNKWVGYMYGIKVDIWADTGEVRDVQEVWSSMPPPETVTTANLNDEALVSEATLNLTMLTLSTLAVVIAVNALFWIRRKKKIASHNLLKSGFPKTSGILLCLCLLIASLFLTSVNTVSATTRGAAVWGSESTGAYGYHMPFNWTWRKSQPEISYQRQVAINIASYFSGNGYTGNNGINHQGIRNPGSSVAQIQNDLIALGNKDYYAVVDFDHGVVAHPWYTPYGELHYMFEDNTGTIIGLEPQGQHYTDLSHAVFDSHVYSYTNSKLIFAFISACESANIDHLGQGLLPGDPTQPPSYFERALGMPFAWTHRLVKDKSTTPGFTINDHISDDGYDDPDWGTQVYIGFPLGSASLSQPIPYAEQGSYKYYDWVCSFMSHALTLDRSINQALDDASWEFLGTWFGNSPLRTGFYPFWWRMTTPPEYSVATLAVYGNGNIKLRYYNPPADVASTPSVSGPTTGDPYEYYEFSAFATNPYGHDVKYKFDWGDGSPYEETGWCSDGVKGYASHYWTTGGIKTVKVQARSPGSGWSSWSSPRTIAIGDLPVLTVNSYTFQYGWCTGVPVWIDDEYVGSTPYSGYVSPGNHKIEVPNDMYFAYFVHYYYGSYNYNNPITISITSDKTVSAYYNMYW